MLWLMLKPIKDFVEAYVNDIGIGSRLLFRRVTVTSCVHVFTIIRDVNKKRDFAKLEVMFVGHFVGSGNIRADPYCCNL